MCVVLLTDCEKSGLLFHPLSKRIWECQGTVHRFDDFHMVFTCRFHQPSVSYLPPQGCHAFTVGTGISINFPKGQLRSGFGNQSRIVQCRKCHWILSNFLAQIFSFPGFVMVYPAVYLGCSFCLPVDYFSSTVHSTSKFLRAPCWVPQLLSLYQLSLESLTYSWDSHYHRHAGDYQIHFSSKISSPEHHICLSSVQLGMPQNVS